MVEITWFKIDDAFYSHPKVIAAGNAAVGLFVRLGAYSSQHLTNGVIPARIVHSFGTNRERKALETVGLIVRENSGDYRIPDFLDYNPSAAKVQADRAATAERVRKWRETNSPRNAVTNSVGNGVSNTAPTRPDPYIPTDIQQPPYVQPVTRPVDNHHQRTRTEPTNIANILTKTRAGGKK